MRKPTSAILCRAHESQAILKSQALGGLWVRYLLTWSWRTPAISNKLIKAHTHMKILSSFSNSFGSRISSFKSFACHLVFYHHFVLDIGYKITCCSGWANLWLRQTSCHVLTRRDRVRTRAKIIAKTLGCRAEMESVDGFILIVRIFPISC